MSDELLNGGIFFRDGYNLCSFHLKDLAHSVTDDCLKKTWVSFQRNNNTITPIWHEKEHNDEDVKEGQ